MQLLLLQESVCFLGLGLAIASIVLAVPKDEKAEEILEVLPGANCGACGFSGCSGYAAALSKGEAAPNLCAPGGADVVQAIAELTGGGAMEIKRKTAMVMCGGSFDHTSDKWNMTGIQSCAAATLTGGGNTKCSYGCMGFGDCVNACDHNAIYLQRSGCGNPCFVRSLYHVCENLPQKPDRYDPSPGSGSRYLQECGQRCYYQQSLFRRLYWLYEMCEGL